jgi:hypothetical protein
MGKGKLGSLTTFLIRSGRSFRAVGPYRPVYRVQIRGGDPQISQMIKGRIMDQSALAQLDIIREISDALTCAGIDHWLFGGWAVDFAVGGMTRPHRDVDFVIWEGDLPRATGRLRWLGYRARSSKHPRHQLNWGKSGTEVQINLITKTADGSIISPGTFSDWPWCEGSFGKHRGRIGDLDVPIVSPAGQLESKENFPKHPAGQPLRAKDLHDIKQLRTLTRSEHRE